VSPGTRIIAFATECDEEREVALFRAGVRGFCALDVSRETLVKAVAQCWMKSFGSAHTGAEVAR